MLKVCGLLAMLWSEKRSLGRFALVSHPKLVLDVFVSIPVSGLVVFSSSTINLISEVVPNLKTELKLAR